MARTLDEMAGDSLTSGGEVLRGLWETIHPAVRLLWAASAVSLAAACSQPWLALTSLVGALCWSVLVEGSGRVVGSLRWQLPMLCLVTLANPLFSSRGDTTLLTLGPWRLTAESLLFGLTMAMLLVGTVRWFSLVGAVVSEGEVRRVLSGMAPAVGLALSMVLSLVPVTVRRVAGQQRALEANTARGSRAAASLQDRSAALLSWSLEEGQVRADSLAARGWGTHHKAVSREPWGSRDVAALLVTLGTVVVAALGCAVSLAGWQAYPTFVAPVRPWAMGAVMVAQGLPFIWALVMEGLWRLRWGREAR